MVEAAFPPLNAWGLASSPLSPSPCGLLIATVSGLASVDPTHTALKYIALSASQQTRPLAAPAEPCATHAVWHGYRIAVILYVGDSIISSEAQDVPIRGLLHSLVIIYYGSSGVVE
jgi:hypothetical protein